MNRYNTSNLRHELKYNLNHMEYRIIQSRLKSVLKSDINCGSNGLYHVRSLYFDDCRNAALSEKLAGVNSRQKYRLRMYNFNHNHIKLERKFKIGKLVGKETASLGKKDVERILNGDVARFAHTEDKLLRAFYMESKRNLLKPNVIVDYYREAFVYPVGNVRITFDLDLHTGVNSTDLFSKENMKVRIPDHPVIMEIKYNKVLPLVISGLISCIGSPQTSISKFVNCKRFSACNAWEDQ